MDEAEPLFTPLGRKHSEGWPFRVIAAVIGCFLCRFMSLHTFFAVKKTARLSLLQNKVASPLYIPVDCVDFLQPYYSNYTLDCGIVK